MTDAVERTLEYLRLGGWVMLPLLAVSWLMWTMIIERLRAFAVLGRSDVGARDAAHWVASTAPGTPPPGRCLLACLLHEFAAERADVPTLDREALLLCAARLRKRLDHRLPAIAALAGVAPLLGLLGTVLGMIETFDVIAFFGTGNVRALSGGLSVALITTQTGLLIAIPGLLMSNRLRRTAQRLRTGLDENTVLLARQLQPAVGGRRQP